MSKRLNAQSHIGGMTVARLQQEFFSEFKDVYTARTLSNISIAVGPMQSFLGFLISEGHITLNLKDTK
jgi:hypothetical protein